jgi:hypothetical protein
MTTETKDELRAAWREATAALLRLRGLLVAAGVELDEAGPAEATQPGETPDERRRRLARERVRRHRDRNAVGVTERYEGVTETQPPALPSVTEALPSVTGSVTERYGSVTRASRARAFLIGDLNTKNPRSATQTCTPTTGERYTAAGSDPIAVTLAGDPGADLADLLFGPVTSEPSGQTADATAEPMPRERPVLARGATNGTLLRSVPVPVVDRPSEGDSDGPALELLPGIPTEPDGTAAVWSAYLEAIAPTRARLTATRSALIARRLRDYPVADLVRSIRGYGKSPFHRGENDRGRPYQALELWLRDAAHVEAGWVLETAQPVAKKRSGPALFDGIEAEWQAIEQQRAAEARALASGHLPA